MMRFVVFVGVCAGWTLGMVVAYTKLQPAVQGAGLNAWAPFAFAALLISLVAYKLAT